MTRATCFLSRINLPDLWRSIYSCLVCLPFFWYIFFFLVYNIWRFCMFSFFRLGIQNYLHEYHESHLNLIWSWKVEITLIIFNFRHSNLGFWHDYYNNIYVRNETHRGMSVIAQFCYLKLIQKFTDLKIKKCKNFNTLPNLPKSWSGLL